MVAYLRNLQIEEEVSDQPVVLPVSNDPHLFLFWCEGCGYMHHIDTRRWVFNYDMHKPTVSPSLLLHPGENHPRCHIFVKEGKIQYLADCTHALAGQTVPMVALDDV